MPDTKAPAALIGFSIEAKFNQSRSVVAQTHVPLDTNPKEIYRQLAKVCEVLDRREEFYLLKGLKITLERDEAQYKTQVEQLGNLENSYRNEFAATGRKGGYELRGQQKTNVENQRTSLKALKDRIDKIKIEIAELEKLQKAYE